MPYEYRKNLTHHSQALRRNMTSEEKRLWYDFLKFLPVTANRQKMIENYIVDFYIHSARLVIEIDGIQHDTESHRETDAEREKKLASLGITVLRYKNETVNNQFSYVCEDILNHLGLTFQDIKK